MKYEKSVYILLLSLIIVAGSALSQPVDLKTEIEKALAFDVANFDSLSLAIYNEVESNPEGAVEIIVPFLDQPGLDEIKLAFLISLLGATQKSEAVPPLCSLATVYDSKQILGACFGSLATINDKAATDCLYQLLDKINNQDSRFGLFNALAEIKYEPALEKSDEIISADAETEYWKPIFFYGKMGEVAVPYLITKIKSEDLNTRFNAINLLGQWLLDFRAFSPLEEQFWVEKDASIQNLILSSIEMISPQPDSVIAFMQKVNKEHKNEASRQFAEEAIKLFSEFDKMKTQIMADKNGTAEEFQAVYDSLWYSFGLEGDYDRLFASSNNASEEVLTMLKERILRRNSDEALGDYKKINQIISMNRLIYKE